MSAAILPQPVLLEQMTHNLGQEAARIGIVMDEKALRLFYLYMRELLLWNNSINLVSDKSVEDIVQRHLVDSLTPLGFVGQSATVMDLGSGGGLPGIPLKIMLPDTHLYLVDSIRKKTSFLSHVVSVLGLPQVMVIRARAEEMIKNNDFVGKFDTVVSRAAFSLRSLLHFSSFFLKPGGQLVAMKGNMVSKKEDVFDAEKKQKGMEFVTDAAQTFPQNNSSRKIIIYRRI